MVISKLYRMGMAVVILSILVKVCGLSDTLAMTFLIIGIVLSFIAIFLLWRDPYE